MVGVPIFTYRIRKGKGMGLETRSRGELIAKLEQVTLRGSGTQPYLNARIDLVTLDPAILAPTQRYVLTKELKKIEQVRWGLLKDHNIDILNLDGYVKCHYEDKTDVYELGQLEPVDTLVDGETVIDVLPPIVEEYFDPKGNLHLIIADGQHRCFLARQMGTLITVAYVRGVHFGYLYYAYPLPRGWGDVEIRDEIEEGYIKKFHSLKDHKSRFRNYNSQFENIGDSRAYAPKQKVPR